MSFISGISLVCFGTSYAIALALEASRLVFRSGVRGAIMLGFAGVGFLTHTLYLATRAVQSGAAPLSSNFDWCLLAAWALAAAYLYLTWTYPRARIGLFILPLVLALVGAAALADRRPIAPEPASRVWGLIHGVFLLLGTVAVMVGFVAGLMYLLQAGRLKRKRAPLSGFRFPSLEWLERVNSRMILISVLMVGIGFLAGIVLNLIGDRTAREVPWSDPVVWTSAMMLGWLVVAAVFNGVYKPARQGRKVAYLTLVSFVFLVISLGTLLLVNTEHSGKQGGLPKKLPKEGHSAFSEHRNVPLAASSRDFLGEAAR